MLDTFKRILVFHDTKNPSNALARAALLAQRNEGKLTLLDVVHSAPIFFRDMFESMDSSLSAEMKKRTGCLEDLAESIRQDGVSVNVKVVIGRPLVEIVREVVTGRHQLLMKDSRSERNELFFGSLDMRLLRYCPVPLWHVNPTVTSRTKRILVAIDPEVNEHELQLNEKIMKMASRCARRDDCELHVVSVWHSPSDMGGDVDGLRERYQALKYSVRRKARENLDAALRASVVKIEETHVHFRNGNAHEAIVDAVDETKPDLLVMGTLARAGVNGIPIGNTAEKVLRSVRCSVLTDKPKDFVSPVADDL